MLIEFPSEKAIEDYVWHGLETIGKCPIGGDTPDIYLRQKAIPGYGVTDIIKIRAEFDSIQVTILELKNTQLCADHVIQLCRYMAGARKIADKYQARLDDCPEIAICGELAGPFDKKKSELMFMMNELESVEFFDLFLSMDSGFSAKRLGKGWHYTNAKTLPKKGLTREISDCVRSDLETTFGESRKVVSINGGDK